jgi:hypothetical protein
MRLDRPLIVPATLLVARFGARALDYVAMRLGEASLLRDGAGYAAWRDVMGEVEQQLVAVPVAA